MEVLDVKIGDRIRAEREKKGLTQDELAKLLGYKSRSAVHKIEQKESLPTKKLQKIADVLGISLAQLMGLNDEVHIEGNYKEQYENIKAELERATSRADVEYYEDREVSELANKIRENSQLKALFDVQTDLEKDDLDAILQMALAFKRKDKSNY